LGFRQNEHAAITGRLVTAGITHLLVRLHLTL
jgi:hypothetical protein